MVGTDFLCIDKTSRKNTLAYFANAKKLSIQFYKTETSLVNFKPEFDCIKLFCCKIYILGEKARPFYANKQVVLRLILSK